ncbi:MAG: hypothetical protein ACE149_16540 [Armatimonadota bacterium]
MTSCGVGSVRELEESWTPAELVMVSQAIRRQQALRDAEQLDLIFIATAGAQGGKECFRAFQRVGRELRERAGFEQPKGDGIKGLAKALGLRGSDPPIGMDRQ